MRPGPGPVRRAAAHTAQVLGPEHPTPYGRADLARFTEAGCGRSPHQYAALLPIEERILGPEHPNTLATRIYLAFWTGAAGDAAGARAGLAIHTGEAGDAAGARDQLAALLPVRERVLGPEHPENLITRAYLAGFTGHAGDAAGARDQIAALLPIEERVLGPEHPATLTDRHGLAHWTGEAGDVAGARDRYAALLPIRERVSGPEHPDTLYIRGNLAILTGEAGDAAGARTGTPRCCQCSSESWAPSIHKPSPHARTSPTGPGEQGAKHRRCEVATASSPARPGRSGLLASPTEIPQPRDTAADPHRNPRDETAHSGTLVMCVKGTENSRSSASMRVSWAVGALFQVCALRVTEPMSGRSYHRRRSRRVTTASVSVRGCVA